jgi:NAD(P) transhydrogenase subunit alpha
VVEDGGVTIVGHKNVPGRIATDASALYARNLVAFLTPLVDKDSKALKVDGSDQIVTATRLTSGGRVVHPGFGGQAEQAA